MWLVLRAQRCPCACTGLGPRVDDVQDKNPSGVHGSAVSAHLAMLLRLSWTAAHRTRPQPRPNWSIAQCRLPAKYAAADSTSVASTASACSKTDNTRATLRRKKHQS